MTYKIDFKSQKLALFVSGFLSFGKRYEIGHLLSVAKAGLRIGFGS